MELLRGHSNKNTQKEELLFPVKMSECDGQDLYHSMVMLCPEPIMLYADGKVMFANPAAEFFLGILAPGELAGKDMMEFIHPNSRPVFEHYIDLGLSGEAQTFLRVDFIRLDGGKVTAEILGVKIELSGKSVIELVVRENKPTPSGENWCQSDYFLQALVESANPIFLKDHKGQYIMANRATTEVLGMSFNELIGKDCFYLPLTPETSCSLAEIERRIIESGQAEVFEETIITSEGNRVFLTTKAPWKDTHGRILGIISMACEITERKALEEQIMKHRDHLRSLVSERTEELADVNHGLMVILGSITDPFFILDKDYRYVFVNKAFLNKQEVFVSEKELIGKSIWDLHPGSIGKECYSKLQQAMVTELPVQSMIKSNSNGQWTDLNIYPFEKGLLVYEKDVTEQIKAADKIKKQAQLLDLAHDYIIVRDMSDKIVFWNRGAEAGYGWNRSEALGQVANRLLRTECSEPFENIMDKVLCTGFWEGEVIHYRKDGERIIVRSHWTLTREEKGDPALILEINYDITRQKTLELSLIESEQRFRECFDNMLDCLSILKPVRNSAEKITDFLIDYVSQMVCLSSNKKQEELVGSSLSAAWPALANGCFKAFRSVVETGKPLVLKKVTCKAEDTVQIIDISIVKLGDGVAACWSDITEQMMLEAELAHLDRLNMVGEMAAIIGHEIRNPLTTVRGYLQMFLKKEPFSGHRKQFETMIEELDRANLIISEYLSMAKSKVVELKPGSLNEVLSALFPLMQADAFQAGHTLDVDMGQTPDIHIDERELRQLLLNLVRNAFEAMQPGGSVLIKSFTEDGHVVLSVGDTGKGIPQEVMNKLGTPFITTKANGTGLGLPVCYRIAERHRAKINVETSPAGTTFYVRFQV